MAKANNQSTGTETEAQKAQRELDEINQAKEQAQKELEEINGQKQGAQKELEEINGQKQGAQKELDELDEKIASKEDTLDELTPEKKAELEDKANNPSKHKYEKMAEALGEKGTMKGNKDKPLISRGSNYQITLNK